VDKPSREAFRSPCRIGYDAAIWGWALGLTVTALNAGNEGEIELAFASDTLKGSNAVVIGADAVLNSMHKQFVALSKRAAMPSMSVQREFVAAGGLMSYGAIAKDIARQTGVYAGRVLKGEKPADLPVLQASKFELVINLTTARTLGLTVPSGMMAIADEVVE
jgi:putative ABC transport system substrate-binding protein